MRLSLLIATLGRTTELERLLKSLREQAWQEYHVYIADQNPPGFLDPLLLRYTPFIPMTVLQIPSCGVSQARNALLPLARGDIIAFPDDDCWYEADTLQSVVDFFTHNPGYAGVLGVWNEAGLCAPTTKLPPYVPQALSPYTAFQGSETYVQFYRQEAVRAVGAFDPELGPGTGLPWGCGEDTDYVLRVINKGLLVGRSPAIRVRHPAPALNASLSVAQKEKIQKYAQGRMYLIKKHRLPPWFQWANVAYPLARLPLDLCTYGWPGLHYRWAMFKGRLRGLLQPPPSGL